MRITNTLNSGLSKTLIEPLNDAVPILAQQVASMCKFSIEELQRNVSSPTQLNENISVDTLVSKVDNSVKRLQHVHSVVLTVPTILRTIS